MGNANMGSRFYYENYTLIGSCTRIVRQLKCMNGLITVPSASRIPKRTAKQTRHSHIHFLAVVPKRNKQWQVLGFKEDV